MAQYRIKDIPQYRIQDITQSGLGKVLHPGVLVTSQFKIHQSIFAWANGPVKRALKKYYLDKEVVL